MRRVLWIGLVIAVAGLAAAGWRLIDTWTPEHTARSLASAIGGDVGRAELSFRPWPMLTGAGLVAGDSRVAAFEATPSVAALLLGRLDVHTLTARGAELSLSTALALAARVQQLRLEAASIVLPSGDRLADLTLTATTDTAGVAVLIRSAAATVELRLTTGGALSALATIPDIGVLRFAGMVEAERVVGRLNLERADAGRALAALGLAGAGAVTGTIDLAATSTTLTATAIDLLAAGSRLSGTARWQFAGKQLDLSLNTPSLDLDRLIRPVLPGPAAVSVALVLEAASVRWQGDVYRRVNLTLDRTGSGATIHRFEAIVPGGVELAGTGEVDLAVPWLAARIELGGDDIRRSLIWLTGAGASLPDALARDFAAVATLDLTATRAVLAGIDASVGASRIAGDATIRLADRRVDVVGTIDQLVLPTWPAVPAEMPGWRGAFDVAVGSASVAGLPIERLRLVGSAEAGVIVLDAASAAVQGLAITAAGTLAGRAGAPQLRLRFAAPERFEVDLTADAQATSLAGSVTHGQQVLALDGILTPTAALSLLDDQDGLELRGTGGPDRLAVTIRSPALIGTGTVDDPLAWALGVGGDLALTGTLARVCELPLDLVSCLGLAPLPGLWRAEVDLPAVTLGGISFSNGRVRRSASDGRTTLTLSARAGGTVELAGLEGPAVTVVLHGVALATLADPTVLALGATGTLDGEGAHRLGSTSALAAQVRGLTLGLDLERLGQAIAAEDAAAMLAALTAGSTMFDRGQVMLAIGDQVQLSRLLGGSALGQVRLDIVDGEARLEVRPTAASGRVVELSWRVGSVPSDGVLTLDRRLLARSARD